MYADLHLHSTFSDGTDTPLELCHLASDCGIRVMSITDHDTISGQIAVRGAQIPDVIEVIPGVELSTEMNRKMLHILGYYIDLFDERLERFIREISAEKTETTKMNFEKACADHVFSYSWERVLEANAGQPRISGVHVVNAMSIDGYEVPGMGLWDMFHRYFWPENDTYLSCQTFTAYDAIDIIKSIGGIPIIAHPKSISDDEIVFDLLEYGAQGLEAFHPIHTVEDTGKYLHMAKSKNLYVSARQFSFKPSPH